MTRRPSTLIGFTAILSWALLALFTAASGLVPPFQLTAMAFAIGGMVGAASWFLRGGDRSVFRQPVAVWLLGVTSLFGYHFLYFTALRSAPAAEASLIAYLWPLLIVVFSGLLPGETLRTHHVLGALIGFLGAALIITNGGSLQIKTDYVPGYLAAIVCALIWSAYSVLSRRFGHVPSDIVTGFCLATAILSALCHLALEETVWPADLLQWLAVLGLGLGPVGLAFFAWDHGVKYGDIQVLGASSYAAPLLSTLVLVVAGFQQANWIIATACALITAGAVLAAKDLLFKRKRL